MVSTLTRRIGMVARLGGLLAMIGLGGTQPSLAGVHSAYDFEFTSIDGETLPLSSFAGKVVMVVNTASFCGFTGQYEGLQTLYDRYKDRGLVILGVPSNDFGQQEPGSTKEIKEFCSTKFNVTFPMTTKYSVVGDEAHPFYKWAADELGGTAKPRWNFHKYLIGPDGKLVDWFSTVTGPGSSRVQASIEKLLASSAASVAR